MSHRLVVPKPPQGVARSLLGVVVVVTMLLAACTAAPVRPTQAPEHLFQDALFAAVRAPESIDPLAASPEMLDYLAREIQPRARRSGDQDALIEALYTRGMLRLDYDSARTRSASEAFAERAGNCLSLVMMTAAFARAMDLPVQFQAVHTDEAIDRSGDLVFFIGHVNLKIGARRDRARLGPTNSDWMTVDFVPGVDLRRQRATPIDEARVLAMYYNNRAAEAMAGGRLDEAYALVRRALALDPSFASSYNTLGVTYSRRGALGEAEQALRFARSMEPGNVHVLGDLASVLQRQGRTAEAEPLLAEWRRLQPQPPFEQFNLGVQAAERGDWARARRLFEAELSRWPEVHQFHFWLARALLALGDARGAEEHLQQAARNSPTLAQGAIYAAKLDKLKPLLGP